MTCGSIFCAAVLISADISVEGVSVANVGMISEHAASSAKKSFFIMVPLAGWVETYSSAGCSSQENAFQHRHPVVAFWISFPNQISPRLEEGYEREAHFYFGDRRGDRVFRFRA